VNGRVYSALLIPPDGEVCDIVVSCSEGVAVVLGDRYVDSLSSDDGVFDFWFGSSVSRWLRPNRIATEFLLTTTGFTASTVPLLYGCVIVCSRATDGSLLGLNDEDHLSLRGAGWLSRNRLRRRVTRARLDGYPWAARMQ
jgi:hypothetical protein